LTLNLRPAESVVWRIRETGIETVVLEVEPQAERIMAQVDCQHRLGHLNDLDISLPFMCFVGLNVREEMEVFNTINSKAKGLSTSLLDFHDAHLAGDLANERPELFVALHLNNDVESPWYRQLDLGGTTTSGLNRRASLRTMQKAIKRFLSATRIRRTHSAEFSAQVILSFWRAVAETLPEQWGNGRKHILNKGVGVYALMDVAADIYNEAKEATQLDRRYFINLLSEFVGQVDWSTDGPLKGLGGEGGVRTAVDHVRDVRRRARWKVVQNG
jgi:DGQHR domain-containing protein